MIGHLYRYPHPYDPTRFIYVRQGAKRDQHHRVGRSSFGRRFKKDFPNLELTQPIRETVTIQNQSELNEMETLWMFQYHTWRGYPDGMNLVLPGSQDYKVAGKIGGPITSKRHGNPRTELGSVKGGKTAGRKNAESGHMSALGKQYGGLYGHVLAEYRTADHQINSGKLGGQKNVETGHIQSLGRKSSAPNGPLARARHERWHVKRSIVSPTCNFCNPS